MIFPNLPYFIDGEAKISESSALLLYAALKAGKEELLGKTFKDKVEVKQL